MSEFFIEASGPLVVCPLCGKPTPVTKTSEGLGWRVGIHGESLNICKQSGLPAVRSTKNPSEFFSVDVDAIDKHFDDLIRTPMPMTMPRSYDEVKPRFYSDLY